MSEEEKVTGIQNKKKSEKTGIGPWDAARDAEMRELAKGTRGDPFELVDKDKPKKKQS